MKKLVALVLATLLALGGSAALAELKDYNVVTTAENNKVIFDTDMGYFGDDTYAMMILLQADAAGYLDLLGITSVGANVTAPESTCAILNQLKALGREDVPVYEGSDVPIMGFNDEKTIELYGLRLLNSMKHAKELAGQITYEDLGELKNETWGYSGLKKQEQSASDFMIEMAHKYPGQVTIMAVGACTNVALAIKKDPTFAENLAGIYYMGGAIDVPGNDTPCAERNWYYDPESVAICLEANFPQQVIVPNDISYNQKLTKEIMDKFAANNNTVYTELIMKYAYPRFEEDPTRRQSLWDAQVPGIFLVPDLISSTDVRQVVMVTDMGYTYGESVAWKDDKGPDSAAKCQIVYDVDGENYWNFVVDLLGTQF